MSNDNIFATSRRNKERRKGSIPPQNPVSAADIMKGKAETAEAVETPVAVVATPTDKETVIPETKTPRDKKRNTSNFKYQARFSGDTKNKLETLKSLNLLDGKARYDYEIIAFLIENYVENNLDAEQRTMFKTFVEMRKGNYKD